MARVGTQPGEGRLSRDLKARGHAVVGVDSSPTLVQAVEQVREVGVPEEAATAPRHWRWQRLPLFLHVRAVRP
jgi:hypothetical protein